MTHAQLKSVLQAKVVRKYKLGSHDRYFLMLGGLANSTGNFPRKREEKSILKLVRLGLLKKEEGKYGTVNFVLTPLGRQEASHINSNR
jgi:hypothetical protein